MKIGWATAASAALLSGFPGPQDLGAPGGGAVPAGDPIIPGLVGTYWYLGEERKDFPCEVTCQEPGVRRMDAAIDVDPNEGRGFGDLPWPDCFAVLWTGTVRLPADTTCWYYFRSRDASKLYLDGDLVLDHDGTHPLKETKGRTVRMKAGDHDLRVEHFQNSKEERCILAWT